MEQKEGIVTAGEGFPGRRCEEWFTGLIDIGHIEMVLYSGGTGDPNESREGVGGV